MLRLPGLLMFVLDLAVLVGIVLHALRRRFDDSDRGVGNVVVLPKPHPPSLPRVALFVGLTVLGSIALTGLRTPDLSKAYRSVVALSTTQVLPEPAVVDAYVSHLRPVIPLSFLAFTIALAVSVHATWGRRLMIVAHAPLAFVAAIAADTVLSVIGVESGISLGRFPLISILMHYLIAYVLAMRLALTTYKLPRPTQVPIRRTGDVLDTLIMATVLLVVSVFVAVGADYLVHVSGDDPVAYTFVLIAVPVYLKFGIYVVLCVLRLCGGAKLPQPGPERPPIDVIGPAFNEETNIVRWVECIDRAAAVYGGPVHLILCDDGSQDATRRLAEEAMARAVAVRGEVIAGSHVGKATALNLALTHCTSDYVIRHDTDCEVHPDSFLYTVPWFESDSRIGLVGAFMFVKQPFTTWVDRMRSMELAAGFGLPRLAYAVVDAQPCVPGNYTAVRREAALEIGGWPEGMLGEDIDFTCSLARLGYRAVYDRRIWAYEDVPEDAAQLRLQRRRWSQGSIYNFARFVPFASGSAGPRFWFAEFFKGARRLVQPMQFAAYLFAIQGAVFDTGVRRNLLHLAAFFLIAKLPMLVLVMCSMFYRGLWRTFLWWPLFFGFMMIKRLANVEALLLLQTRPVSVPWLHPVRRTAPDADITWPVLRPRYLPEAESP
ncbi:glycosyltransferase family 2 protein [Streptacidiphilus sp. PB12-B1b]|uniref:glycosyltransferase n=1 Tax=Streptacidiphilus sp. PB12-B1b TaxID=2705012 RepID=UPI0015FC1C9E|nr:glycosyltransferase family 2 protein [Streptacidiphilus sp. PB12-B1b]QMU76609.1 glycosyltransferase family 2 protein [Streptacidiphilus sp. PB12-B1b]